MVGQKGLRSKRYGLGRRLQLRKALLPAKAMCKFAAQIPVDDARATTPCRRARYLSRLFSFRLWKKTWARADSLVGAILRTMSLCRRPCDFQPHAE
eukprot:scaffold21745_cov32-Tisochrysis_lutea.AAC.2